MRIEDCMLSRRVSELMVGCKNNTAPLPECDKCGWNKYEDARRRKLPLIKGEDGLLSRRGKSERKRTTCAKRVIYTSPETGEEVIYGSITEAAKAAGISHWAMYKWLDRTVAKECAKNWRYADEKY